MNDSYRKALGQVLAEKREAAGLNKQQLSLMVGVNRPSIRLIECGEANPTVDMLLKITRGLGVSLADIMVETERRLAGSEEGASAIPHAFPNTRPKLGRALLLNETIGSTIPGG